MSNEPQKEPAFQNWSDISLNFTGIAASILVFILGFFFIGTVDPYLILPSIIMSLFLIVAILFFANACIANQKIEYELAHGVPIEQLRGFESFAGNSFSFAYASLLNACAVLLYIVFYDILAPEIRILALILPTFLYLVAWLIVFLYKIYNFQLTRKTVTQGRSSKRSVWLIYEAIVLGLIYVVHFVG